MDAENRFEISEFTLEVPAATDVGKVTITAPTVGDVAVEEPPDNPASTRWNPFAVWRFQFIPSIDGLPNLVSRAAQAVVIPKNWG